MSTYILSSSGPRSTQQPKLFCCKYAPYFAYISAFANDHVGGPVHQLQNVHHRDGSGLHHGFPPTHLGRGVRVKQQQHSEIDERLKHQPAKPLDKNKSKKDKKTPPLNCPQSSAYIYTQNYKAGTASTRHTRAPSCPDNHPEAGTKTETEMQPTARGVVNCSYKLNFSINLAC